MKVYQPGRLGVAEGCGLIFGMVIARLFLTGIAEVIKENGQIVWLAMLLYTILPGGAALLLLQVCRNSSGDFYEVCCKLVGGWGGRGIVVIYGLLFGINGALLLRQYAEYTLITALPLAEFQVVIAWYGITAGILCYLGLEALGRVGYITLPVIFLGMAAVFIMVSPVYIIYNLLPWQGNGWQRAIYSGMNGVGYNLGAMMAALLAGVFADGRRTVVYALGIATVLRLGMVAVYLMTFGAEAGGEKAMPLFELMRLVHISEFIQRIESIFIVLWVFSGIMAIAGSLYMALYMLALLLRLPSVRALVPLGVSIMVNSAMLPPDIETTIAFDHWWLKGAQAGIYLFPVLLFIRLQIKRKRSAVL